MFAKVAVEKSSMAPRNPPEGKVRSLGEVALGMVLAFTLVACDPGEDGDHTADAAALPPLPSTCTVPELPLPLAANAVVGEGSPASCTREALQIAVAGGGNVTFDCGETPHTIVIDSEILIGAETILDGSGDGGGGTGGVGSITLDGGGTSRLLSVDNHVTLTVIGLTFTRGFATTNGEDRASGGAIRGGWRGSVSAFDCVFADNVAGSEGEEGGGAMYVPSDSTMVIVRSTFLRNRGGTGGAVHNLLSGLTIVDSTFVDNVSDTGGGGAVYTDGASGETNDDVGGVIELCGCQFEGNRSLRTGGAAYLFAYPPDRISVNQCVFDGNAVARDGQGSGALGGGLRTGNAPLQLAHSLFVDNHADVHGGGLWVDGNFLTEITNCTFVGNDAGVAGEEGGYGGAISGANLLIESVTLAGNHAAHSGGAIFNEDNTSVTVNNSIIAANTAANEWGLDQSCRDTMPGSNNLQWPGPEGNDPPCTADPMGADPLLGDLSDNGGPTPTLPLLIGSPAIDAGQDCPDTDQRGLPRADTCDLGAFEVQP
jgi:Chlamydia polymorphic membrane protein (Chlamydia_PMP) repeat